MIGIQECCTDKRNKVERRRKKEREMSFVINLRCIKNSARGTNILMISICEIALERPIMQHFHSFFVTFPHPPGVEKSCDFLLIIYFNLVKEVNEQFSLKIALRNYYLLLMRQRKHTTETIIKYKQKKSRKKIHFVDEKYTSNG